MCVCPCMCTRVPLQAQQRGQRMREGAVSGETNFNHSTFSSASSQGDPQEEAQVVLRGAERWGNPEHLQWVPHYQPMVFPHPRDGRNAPSLQRACSSPLHAHLSGLSSNTTSRKPSRTAPAHKVPSSEPGTAHTQATVHGALPLSCRLIQFVRVPPPGPCLLPAPSHSLRGSLNTDHRQKPAERRQAALREEGCQRGKMRQPSR